MSITYDDSHKKTVESGTEAVREVLFGGNTLEIRKLLFCLDLYLDPYYKNTLPYEPEIYDLLQELAVTSRDDDVIDDCLQLIDNYSCSSLAILEHGFDRIKDSMKPYAQYILNKP